MTMQRFRVRLLTVLALACLALLSASPIAAAPNGPGGNPGNNNPGGGNNNPPGMAATPELDSVLLFGSGAAGMAGYALTRLRAGRRRDTDPD